MADENGAEKVDVSAFLPQISPKIEISASDLTSIATAREEERLKDLKKEAQAKVKELRKASEDARKKVQDKLKLLAESGLDHRADDIVKAFGAFGEKVEYEVSFDVRRKPRTNVDRIHRWVELRQQDCGNPMHTFQLDILEKDEELKALETTLDEANEELNQAEKAHIEIKRELGNLSSIERKARAAMTSAILGHTPDGQMLLDSIKTDGDGKLLLPG